MSHRVMIDTPGQTAHLGLMLMLTCHSDNDVADREAGGSRQDHILNMSLKCKPRRTMFHCTAIDRLMFPE